jgi:hypothetical protein|tara:strand:+ start:8291 stop:8467 length:177 start_codon:yes stop_codon:yes gene_type:complete
MGKLFKHKSKPRKETSSFTTNSSKEIYQLKDGSTIRQSHLNGKKQRFNKKDKPVGKAY